MKRITDLKILKEFTYDSVVYGFYWAKFNGEDKLFTRNGNVINALTHCVGDGDKLMKIRDDVKEELLNEIENIK